MFTVTNAKSDWLNLPLRMQKATNCRYSLILGIKPLPFTVTISVVVSRLFSQRSFDCESSTPMTARCQWHWTTEQRSQVTDTLSFRSQFYVVSSQPFLCGRNTSGPSTHEVSRPQKPLRGLGFTFCGNRINPFTPNFKKYILETFQRKINEWGSENL